jgi:glycosyltransferase XagB
MFDQRLADARALGEACDGLARRSPELSARGGLSPGQRAGGWALLGALAMLTWLAPGTLPTLGGLAASALFSLIIGTRIAAALVAGLNQSAPDEVRAADDTLLTLTILVPLYREARVAAGLVDALAGLDYPTSHREVKLLVEADDDETLSTLLETSLPNDFEIIPVPPALPRTKPKALNYGLATARGDIVAVFDAEDRPSPDQPRAAVAAFAAGGDDLFAVQAPLAIHNGGDGWMQRQFEIEYAIHFRAWLPFLARLGAPLPLGGTSNYFRGLM